MENINLEYVGLNRFKYCGYIFTIQGDCEEQLMVMGQIYDKEGLNTRRLWHNNVTKAIDIINELETEKENLDD